MSITEKDVDNLRHMVAAGAKPRDRGYRNYFATHASDPEMLRLVDQGLAVMGHTSGSMTYFKATPLGCKVAGLDAKQTARALED